MTSRSFFAVAGLVSMVGACGGATAGEAGSSDSPIVGTWGVTTSRAVMEDQHTVGITKENFLVFGPDKTLKHYLRTSRTYGLSTASTSICGSGTYVFENGVVSLSVDEKYPQVDARGGTLPPITKTSTTSGKVEFIDGRMSVTTDSGGSSDVTVFDVVPLPEGLEESCPR